MEPFIDPVFENNVLLTQTERLMMSGRPKHPKYARNKNVIVIGGSGSGKTRFFVKPNLMQMPEKVSYVCTDPKGTIIIECGKMLSDAGYKIKVLNTINFKKSMVTSENYVLGYKASLIQGVTPVQIRERMEKLNPDRFRVRKFGVSDVIVTSIGGKTQSYYVNPKELIKFNGFFTKLPNGEYLLLNEEGYQVEGQKGTWTVTDEKTIDEQRFVLMVNDQKPDLLPSIVVQSDGKFMTTTSSGFDNATVRKVRELLHHEKFLENGTAERARESGTEQNYNMIDGCVNNVPKKPRVIGGRVSVLDRLHIKQAERARKDNAQVQQQERTRKN